MSPVQQTIRIYLVKKLSLEFKWFAYGENFVSLRNQFNPPCSKAGSVLLRDDVTGSCPPSQEFALAKALPGES